MRTKMLTSALALLIVFGGISAAEPEKASPSRRFDAPPGSEDGDPPSVPDKVRASIKLGQDPSSASTVIVSTTWET